MLTWASSNISLWSLFNSVGTERTSFLFPTEITSKPLPRTWNIDASENYIKSPSTVSNSFRERVLKNLFAFAVSNSLIKYTFSLLIARRQSSSDTASRSLFRLFLSTLQSSDKLIKPPLRGLVAKQISTICTPV